MKKFYVILAAVAGITLTSCTSNEYLGDLDPTANQADGSIQFGLSLPGATRADIVGNAAADLLGNNFYVTGTKGSEETNNPSKTLVFDNYLVHYGDNTAGTTESNTANWEYVGVKPGTAPTANYVKLGNYLMGDGHSGQTIKYWDYSTEQYDFLAFSTGKKAAVSKTTFTGGDALTADEIGVTAMKYGTGLAGGATAYTFYIPTIDALKNAYITDVITVPQTSYGNEVKLTFKNLGSKIRLALYETIPGYSVKNVKFYTVDGTSADLGSGSTTTAALISADVTNGFSTTGTAVVSFPEVGSSNSSSGNYKKASVSVTPVAPAEATLYQTFGLLNNYQDKELDEASGDYLGRNITEATYAGYAEVDYYQVVFPVTSSSALTLRVDYTLVSTDGSGETINVYGAKAVVPSTYTVWQPNYAYTYIFKISDNTNGWTNTDATQVGLFPITFDAVVAEIKDVSGEQRTVTTVATPSITTYQQKHDKTKDEYSKATAKDIYVQVMDNDGTTTPKLVGFDGSSLYKLNATTPSPESTNRSRLFAVTLDPASKVAISEATVMDALQNQTSATGTPLVITGRNGVILTEDATNIDATVETIVNGADDKAIDLRDKDVSGDPIANSGKGKAAKINIGVTAGTYAYVYDYSDVVKTTKTFYQPTGQTSGVIADGTKYITLEKLATIVAKTSGEAANDGYIYFSKTTTDGTNYTYSYYSVDGKTGNLPDGLLKVSKTTDLLTGDGNTTTVTAGDFIFNIYTRNTGEYAVKVIKIVA